MATTGQQDHRLHQPNNIGLLRLLLASLVILGHAPEMIDGNRSRDPIFAVFGVLSLGHLAVEGFFFISGILITRSMLNTQSVGAFAVRRILRIYPAFIVASLLGFYAFGSLVGTEPFKAGLRPLLYIAALKPTPDHPGQLAGLPIPIINGQLGTIIYEARCYALVAILWLTGILARRWPVLLMAACFVILTAAMTFSLTAAWLSRLSLIRGFDAVAGEPGLAIPFTAAFLMGSCLALYQNDIRTYLTGWTAAASGVAALLILSFNTHLAEAGVILFGAASLWWLAYAAKLGPLQKINNDWDISYGVYLYGWPIATGLLWSHRQLSPWALAGITLPVAMMAGAASWWGLEKRALSLAKAQRKKRASNVMPHAIAKP